jgi:lipid-A-disaccharide synthase
MASDPKPLTIFFSAGDPSGDLHAANLIRQLRGKRPHLDAVGYGGPLMEAAGLRLQTDLTVLAVMGILPALAMVPKFRRLVGQAEAYFRQRRPDAVVLVDFPGFNWWIARRAKAQGIPVFYYVPPQIWGWAQWRVKKMRRLVDHVLSTLPFEAKWLTEQGCHATFVGHPFFDEVRRQELDPAFLAENTRPGPLVTILPGSRTQEVKKNLATFLRAAARVRQRVPDVRFAVASFKESQAELARRAVEASGLEIPVHVGRTPELIYLAEVCMAVSGSVSLELLHRAKPTVILYRVTLLDYFLQSILRKVKYVTLVNLLATDELFPRDRRLFDPRQKDADRVLFPEYVTCGDRSEQIAAHLIHWLTDAGARQERIDDLAQLRAKVGHAGATNRAADYILKTLCGETPSAK